jgi:glycosyltransferase involved in cell wall biosynthesis
MRETPVITLNCDPDNIIKNNKIGFHSGCFENMVDNVKYIIENKDELRKMGKKAREYAIKNHDIKKIGIIYSNSFERLLKE